MKPTKGRKMLQWSHVHSNVETGGKTEMKHRVVNASMEPRSFKRGNAFPDKNKPVPIGASMEPHSFKRGNGRPHKRVGPANCRFNGATFIQTWKLAAPSKAIRH